MASNVVEECLFWFYDDHRRNATLTNYGKGSIVEGVLMTVFIIADSSQVKKGEDNSGYLKSSIIAGK